MVSKSTYESHVNAFGPTTSKRHLINSIVNNLV